MTRGQTTVLALFSLIFLVVGLILFIPLFTASGSIMGDDSLLTLLGSYSWVFIGIAVIASFFVWSKVGSVEQ